MRGKHGFSTFYLTGKLLSESRATPAQQGISRKGKRRFGLRLRCVLERLGV
jgi:hypothetical protein